MHIEGSWSLSSPLIFCLAWVLYYNEKIVLVLGEGSERERERI